MTVQIMQLADNGVFLKGEARSTAPGKVSEPPPRQRLATRRSAGNHTRWSPRLVDSYANDSLNNLVKDGEYT